MKKTIALLLVLIILLSAVPAFASNTRTSGLYTYEIKGNGTITITGFDWEGSNAGLEVNEYHPDLFIPNMIDGYTVTAIGDEAFCCEKPQYITYSVTLPETIKSIGDKAFWNSYIESINIPDNVQIIGHGVFVGCPKCKFKINSQHAKYAVIDGALYDKSAKELLAACEGINYSNEGKTLNIPEGIKSIGDYALSHWGRYIGSSKYLEVSLPSSLESIGDYALYNANLNRLEGTVENVKALGAYAFSETDVDKCYFDFAGLESIGEGALYNMKIDGTLQFSSGLKTIPDKTFTFDSHWYHIEVDTKNISQIGTENRCLGECYTSAEDFSPALTTIPSDLNPQVSSLPLTVTNIESKAFRTVTDFRLSDALTDIAVDAFPKGSTFIVDAGSYAELWCSENGFGYTVEGQEDNLSWLNS